MRGKILLSLVALVSMGALAAAPPPIDPGGVKPAPVEVIAPFISTGERVSVKEKNFSIIPPVGWEVRQDMYAVTMYFQPKVAKGEYQKNIQVNWGAEPIVIDEFTAKEYSQDLIEKRSKFGGVSNYRLRNQLPVTLENGTKGILFYNEFNYNEYSMMELDVLVSSVDGHFLMTYTDEAKNFESDQEGSPLNIAFNSLMSAQLSAPVAGRFDFLIKAAIGLGVFMVFWTIIRFFQGRHRFREFDDSSEVDDESGNWGGHKSSHGRPSAPPNRKPDRKVVAEQSSRNGNKKAPKNKNRDFDSDNGEDSSAAFSDMDNDQFEDDDNDFPFSRIS